MTDDIEKVVEKVKKEEMMILDMRDFESYMKGHIPNSILAPYVEGRWAPEISNFLSSRDSPTIVLYESDEEKNVASSELSKLGHELQFLKYKEFKQAGNFQEAHATNLRPDEFGEHIEDYQVIDVREPYEWNSGYIDNAHLIPLNDLFIEYEKLDKKRNTPLFVPMEIEVFTVQFSLLTRGLKFITLMEAWMHCSVLDMCEP